MGSAQLVHEEARKVLRAYRAWEWARDYVAANPPPADGLRHPEADLEEILVDCLVRSVHDLARISSLDTAELVAALVGVGVPGPSATAVVALHAKWLATEEP